jgi:uncharacterized protein (DUF58 family)
VRTYLPFLLLLLVLAAVLRADFVLTIFYVFAGMYFIGQWWTHRALAAIRFSRTYQDRAFLGEQVTVALHVANTGRLPIVWLRIHDTLPINLATPNFFRQVVSLGPRAHQSFHYELDCRRRGYYPIGPLWLQTGDVLGVSDHERRERVPQRLIVYPRIVPLTSLGLPSQSPFGTLRHYQPIFEDPSRSMGKRDYLPGDSPRRIDWKATAAAGRLQTRLFEPSIALETFIFLNLNQADYERRRALDSSERAIVVAASIANWVIGQRQAVGLATNGLDPLEDEAATRGQGDTGTISTSRHLRAPVSSSILPRKGRAHLMRLLDVLARVELADTFAFDELLRRETVRLPWGTTLVVVTARATDALFDALLQVRRAGFQVVLILVESRADFPQVQRRARRFGFVAYRVASEWDLDIWRQ